MTIQWAERGRGLYGSQKSLYITPYVNEQVVTTQTLTTGTSGTMPGGITPLASYTVNTSTMAPTFSGVNVVSYYPVYGCAVGGQNTSGASVTVWWQINRNGSNFKTGNTSVANNNYWTLSFMDSTFVNGDVIDIYVWTSASSGVNFTYKNITCHPSRVDVGSKYMINASFKLTTLTSAGLLPATGKAGGTWVGNVYCFPSATDNTISYSFGSNVTCQFLTSTTSYKAFQIQGGEVYKNYTLATSTTQLPCIVQNNYPNPLTYRDLFI